MFFDKFIKCKKFGENWFYLDEFVFRYIWCVYYFMWLYCVVISLIRWLRMILNLLIDFDFLKVIYNWFLLRLLGLMFVIFIV